MTLKFNSALTLDIPRATKTLDHLRAHPEEHYQSVYGVKTFCGTTMCIAGTVVHQDPEAGPQLQWITNGGITMMVGPGNGNECGWIHEQARELLGLHEDDACRLFGEWDNQTALDVLADWIEQAEKAQV